MPILLDTNIYLFAMRSDDGAVFFERRFLPLVFQTYLASIVVEELYAQARATIDDQDFVSDTITNTVRDHAFPAFDCT